MHLAKIVEMLVGEAREEQAVLQNAALPRLVEQTSPLVTAKRQKHTYSRK